MKSVEKPMMPPKEVITFTQRLGAILRFGVPLSDAIEIASRGTVGTSRVKQAIRRVKESAAAGASFSDALSRERPFFPPIYIAAVAQGEKTGNLPSALKDLAEHFDEFAATRALARRLSLYPPIAVLVTLLIAAVGLFLLLPIALLPTRGFKEILDAFDTTLPATGFGFFWIVGTFLADHSLTIVLTVCGVAALTFLIAVSTRPWPRARLIIEKWKLGLPLYGRSMKNVNLLILCDAVGRHLEHGFALSQALVAAQRAVANTLFREEIARVAQDVQAGSTLSETMKKSKWFPLSLIRAVEAGESKAQIASVFLDMANSYREESKYSVRRVARWATGWVGSLAGAFVLFCVATFLVTIVTFLTGSAHG